MIRAFTHSEAGGHLHNEDAFAVHPHNDGCLCALSDGQGGRAGGAAAAKLACKACIELAEKIPSSHLHSPMFWVETLQSADAAVAAHPDAGFTTLIAFYLTQDSICGASCGDSEILLLHGNQSKNYLTERQKKKSSGGIRRSKGRWIRLQAYSTLEGPGNVRRCLEICRSGKNWPTCR